MRVFLNLLELPFTNRHLFLGLFFRISQIKIMKMWRSLIKMRGVVMKASTSFIGL